MERTGAEAGDLIVFAADGAPDAAGVLGALRGALIELLAPEPSRRWSMLWVVEFPLFEIDAETGKLTYGHNPFSRPTDETLACLDSEPLRMRGAQYDLVLNGVELGSGSLRIPDAALQRKVLRTLGLSDERIDESFGWFLEALSTARRRTAASAWASTASSCCWPASRRSATSSPFPRPPPGPIP